MARLNRSAFTPIYSQVADILSSQIQAGEIAAGEKLPSERDLMQTYQLSIAGRGLPPMIGLCLPPQDRVMFTTQPGP